MTNPEEPFQITHEPTLTALIDHIRSEYTRVTNLSLTAPQARRLWSVEETRCEAVLGALVYAGYLARTSAGRYVRRPGLNGSFLSRTAAVRPSEGAMP